MKVVCDFPKHERAVPAEEMPNVRGKSKYQLGSIDKLKK
jgi:hypothetical protein